MSILTSGESQPLPPGPTVRAIAKHPRGRQGESGSTSTPLLPRPYTAPPPAKWRRYLPAAALGFIILLACFLRFYQLGSSGYGNEYYAATVKSMLTSWHNFFYAAYEPGGSVSVDKPPLGFWIEAGSALIFGVNGFALAFPNALAGVLSIPLLYSLVRRPFGQGAGLVAALVLALTPVTVATERNNTIDGMLIFVLLLAAWAFLRAVHSGKARYLMLGALLVGLGFNIKMLQALMPLPGFYLLYLLGAPHRWWKKLVHLVLASLLLGVVSLAWVAAVDLTPPSQRPYVGSSTDNSELELVVGHNGLSRLFSGWNMPRDWASLFFPSDSTSGSPSPLSLGGGGGRVPGIGGGAFSEEVGKAGVLRLFTQPLVEEVTWLLPLALLAILLILAAAWGRSFGEQRLALALWAGWLVPSVLFFTFTTGLFHAYYMAMIGPPVAALCGGALWALVKMGAAQRWLGWGLAGLSSLAVLALQWSILQNYSQFTPLALGIGLLWLVSMVFLAWRPLGWARRTALGLLLGSLLAAPLVWSVSVTLDPTPNTSLPNARMGGGFAVGGQPPDGGGRGLAGGPPGALGHGLPVGPGGFAPGLPSGVGQPGNAAGVNAALLSFLEANTPPGSYLFATENAQEASPYILATGRPVLTFGGFTGSDNVIDVAGLQALVQSGQLRYISGGGPNSRPGISSWVAQNCKPVSPGGGTAGRSTFSGINTLYDCVPSVN